MIDQGLALISIEAIDDHNRVMPRADKLIEMQIEGSAILVGLRNGNFRSYNSFQSQQVPLFNGKALLVLRTLKNTNGKIKVIATSDKLSKGVVTIKAK